MIRAARARHNRQAGRQCLAKHQAEWFGLQWHVHQHIQRAIKPWHIAKPANQLDTIFEAQALDQLKQVGAITTAAQGFFAGKTPAERDAQVF